MKQDFGYTGEHRRAYLYTLENDSFKVQMTNYGACLTTFIDKKTGIDIVHGFDSLEEYEHQDFYIGATIGRTANRIAKGIFHLNGKEYHIPVNNNGNANHGGIRGFNSRMFEAREGNGSVIFSYLSKDSEEGYPGNLKLEVTYHLLRDGLSITYRAESDKDTIFAPTNHSYFNLDGSEDACSHLVCIHADRFGLSDPDGLTLENLVPVENTPFDFRKFKPVGQDISQDNEQLHNGNGYDHFYPVDGKGLRLMAEAYGRQIHLSMYSNMPGMHFYTSNWLNGIEGKYGHHYKPRSAICFEAEFMPNAVNYDDAEKPLLKAGEEKVYEIQYRLNHDTI